MSEHLAPDHSFDLEVVKQELLTIATDQVKLSKHTQDLRVIQRDEPASVWIRRFSSVPGVLDAAVGRYPEYYMTAEGFSKGAHFALQGIRLAGSAALTPELSWPNIVLYCPDVGQALSNRDNDRPLSIWAPGFQNVCDNSYAAIPTHHESLGAWAARAVDNADSEVYFKRGYSLMLHVAKQIVEKQVQSSFLDFMHQTGTFEADFAVVESLYLETRAHDKN